MTDEYDKDGKVKPDDPNWSWRKGRKKGKPRKQAIDGYSEGKDPRDKAGRLDACIVCPASLACLTMPEARENGREGNRRKDWQSPIRAHLHWCPLCKRNYFQMQTGDGIVDNALIGGTSANELAVSPMCPALLDFDDKSMHSVVCWECRQAYKNNQSPSM